MMLERNYGSVHQAEEGGNSSMPRSLTCDGLAVRLQGSSYFEKHASR